MKKLFLTCLMLASTVNLFTAGVHIPAAGPIQLGDNIMGGPRAGVARGAIMSAVIGNNPANPNSNPILAAANAAITNFDGQGQNFKSYQAIITNIGQSTRAQVAIDAVKAFENVIMYLYDYEIYMFGGYKLGTSIFVTGVRWSWINPLSYFSPKSYFSDNNARAKQLIDELDKLADVVKIHSAVEYLRIKATVHSYRHWRRNMMLTVAAYLVADRINNDHEHSIVNQSYQGGFENAGEMAINHMINFGSGLYYIGSGFVYGAHGMCNVACKVGGVMLHGKKAFVKKDNNRISVDNVGKHNNNVDPSIQTPGPLFVQNQQPDQLSLGRWLEPASTLKPAQGPVGVATKSWKDYWKSYCDTFPNSKIIEFGMSVEKKK